MTVPGEISITVDIAEEGHRGAPRISGRFDVVTRLPRTLQACPRFDQRAVHREVLSRDQSLRARSRHSGEIDGRPVSAYCFENRVERLLRIGSTIDRIARNGWFAWTRPSIEMKLNISSWRWAGPRIRSFL